VTIALYRQKPEPRAVYEAVHWTGDNCAEVFTLLGLPHPEHDRNTQHDEITLPVRAGGSNDTAWVDDWILRETSTGDFSAEGDEDFRAYYEPDGTGIPAFAWGQTVSACTDNGTTTVTIPFDSGGDWTGDMVLDLADVRVLHDMLGGLLEEAGDE